ncbi:MAG: AAA family ATPase [Bacteroidota bacterium]|nr:AAA family ATPase [Bacteroidota bacterium]
MILAVGNIKGGVGKTTLAINIAIFRALAGHDVLLVDGDEQRTALTFTDLRIAQLGYSGYTIVSLHGVSLRTQVRQLASKYEDIIIDVGGRDTGSLRAALTIAETFLIPVQPRSFDIWAMDQVVELIKEAREINKLRVVAVLNSADAQGHDNKEAAQVLSEMGEIEMLNVPIGRRKAFPNAAAIGRSVIEQIPKDCKAITELTSLVNSLFLNKQHRCEIQ